MEVPLNIITLEVPYETLQLHAESKPVLVAHLSSVFHINTYPKYQLTYSYSIT